MSTIRPKTLPDLHHFTGTENWWKYPYSRFTYTDGIKHVAEKAKAYWLLDVIFSHAANITKQERHNTDQRLFMVFNLKVNPDDSAVFTAEDGNGNVFDYARQEIGYTDFPAKSFKCYLTDNVCMLPSEY